MCWKITNFYHGITRFAVPSFIMIIGSLNLDIKRNWTSKKIFMKVMHFITVFLCWQFFYAIYRMSQERVLDSSFIFGNFLKYITKTHFHLWYIPTLLELIIITPFLWQIVNSKNGKKLEEAFIILFFFLKIVPVSILAFPFSNYDYVKYFINLVQPDIITGFAGYYLLGHYLFHYKIPMKIEKVIIFLGISGITMGIFLCQWFSIRNNKPIDEFYNNFSIATFFYSMAIIIFLKNKICNESRKTIVNFLGAYIWNLFDSHFYSRYIIQNRFGYS